MVKQAIIAATVIVTADMAGDAIALAIARSQAPGHFVPTIELVPAWLVWSSRVAVGITAVIVLDAIL